jgi:hypothetical protein
MQLRGEGSQTLDEEDTIRLRGRDRLVAGYVPALLLLLERGVLDAIGVDGNAVYLVFRHAVS